MPKFVDLHLRLSPVSHARLVDLKEMTHAESEAEVIGNALRLYEHVVKEAGKEAKVVITRPDGTTEIVRIFV